MTEKRFKVFNNGFSMHIEDTNYTEDKHEHNLYDIDEMCDKLNEFAGENEQLKSRIEDYNTALKRLQDLADKKIKENEQLKSENNLLKCALALGEITSIVLGEKEIDIPPYYEFEDKIRYKLKTKRREYDGYD